MGWSLLRRSIDAGEIDTAMGRALVEERHAALRRQVPIIYTLALVNLCGLQVATDQPLALGLNLPTVLLICGLLRSIQWIRAEREVSHQAMLRRMAQTWWLAAVLCLAVSLWCLYLLTNAAPGARMAVILFGGLTAIGVAYGLSALPSAARMALVVLALPLSAVAFLSRDPHLVGAAVSLAAAALLVSRLLALHSRQFDDVVRSRAMISRQKQLADQARQEALQAAATDFLTGLPNRRAFVAALQAAIGEQGEGEPFAVALVDLDRFKLVNDTFGHASGDELLQTVARRLSRAAGTSAVVARLGGDEFGLLFPGVDSAAHARVLGETILAEVNRCATLRGRQFAVGASCGIGISRRQGNEERSPSRALADADVALYQAKAQTTGRLALFQPQMEAPRRRRTQIEQALRLPGIQEDIHLVFQPIVDLSTGRIVASEALARWRHDELGDISPSEFVPAAEQLNIIGDISDHLFAAAVAEAAAWPGPVRLSFNLSAVQLCTSGLADSLLATLDRAGLDCSRLQVEVTETALLADFESARRNLARLRSAGVCIVLDDFGAGYASIGYLREIQFDQIKLDGGLVTAAGANEAGKRLLAAVIGLCRALGVSAVAEHVESEDQLRLLLKLGCTLGQGFWLQPPVGPADAAAMAETGTLTSSAGETLRRSAA